MKKATVMYAGARKPDLVLTTKPTLKELQKYVGGYVEVIKLRDGRQMIVNEEAALRGDMLPNERATDLIIQTGTTVNIGSRGIVGDVVVVSGWRYE